MIFMKNLLEINRTLWAKKTFFRILACSMVVLVLMTACKKKQDPETFLSDKARPSWTIPSDYDYTSSMTAVVKVNLKAQYPELAADWQRNANDLLAAFSGDKCLGIGEWVDGAGAYWLYIAGTEGKITLRYYSAYYKNLFEAKDAFPYVNDGNVGTADNPYVPTFVVAK